jgi:hypothetical protein
MGGGNKEIILIDSIRNGDSQTAIKLLQNSMIKNQSIKSKLNQKLNSHLASSNTSLAGSPTAQSNSSIFTTLIILYFYSKSLLISPV